MANHTIVLNENELQELARIVAQEIADTRVEMHRTHTPKFRDEVRAEEDLLRGLLEKLKPQAAVAQKK